MYIEIDRVYDLINQMQKDYSLSDKTLAFYRQRVSKFFDEYMALDENSNMPLDAITYYIIDQYFAALDCSDAEKINVYSSLKRFFEYCYSKKVTHEIMSQVKKPDRVKKKNLYLDNIQYQLIVEYIFNQDYPIYDRLLLGLFLYTGLSRKYIFEIGNSSFIFFHGVYSLSIWVDGDNVTLPLKSELQVLIHEYLSKVEEGDRYSKLVRTNDDNALSSYVHNLTKSILGERITPTILSNTFILKALSSGNYIWEVSKLTQENVSTIAQHISDTPSDMLSKQIAILNSF